MTKNLIGKDFEPEMRKYYYQIRVKKWAKTATGVLIAYSMVFATLCALGSLV